MDPVRDFLDKWERHFPGGEIPLGIFFSDDPRYERLVLPTKGFVCLIDQVTAARKGERKAFTLRTIGCAGGRRYSGFSFEPRPDLKEFLSCGVPGRMEGLRLKASPDLVAEGPDVPKATGSHLVVSRLDRLEDGERPQVVAWFARPDALSALVHLVAYRTADRNCVIAPQGAACAGLVGYPMAEGLSPDPRGVLGMFDLSARPHVEPCVLTLAVPWPLFVRMTADMDESFLTAKPWRELKGRDGA